MIGRGHAKTHASLNMHASVYLTMYSPYFLINHPQSHQSPHLLGFFMAFAKPNSIYSVHTRGVPLQAAPSILEKFYGF